MQLMVEVARKYFNEDLMIFVSMTENHLGSLYMMEKQAQHVGLDLFLFLIWACLSISRGYPLSILFLHSDRFLLI